MGKRNKKSRVHESSHQKAVEALKRSQLRVPVEVRLLYKPQIEEQPIHSTIQSEEITIVSYLSGENGNGNGSKENRIGSAPDFAVLCAFSRSVNLAVHTPAIDQEVSIRPTITGEQVKTAIRAGLGYNGNGRSPERR